MSIRTSTAGAHPVLVMGGGLAGLSCARELARHGVPVQVAVGGARRSRLPQVCSPSALALLGALFDAPLPGAMQRPVRLLQSAWGSHKLDGRSLPFWGASAGAVVDREVLDSWALTRCRSAGIDILDGCDIREGSCRADGWTLVDHARGARQILRASFVVDATGRDAPSALQPDATRLAIDALVCVWWSTQAGGDDDRVLVEASPDGWWFTVCDVDGHRVVGLFTDADSVAPAPSRESWLREALSQTRHVAGVAGRVPDGVTLHACDARTSIRRVLCRNRWIAVGDAAWAPDPLSGSGMVRALTDGAAVARLLAEAIGGRARRAGPTDGHHGAALRSHALSEARAFFRFVETQHRYYGLERRWAGETFWMRRCTEPAAPPFLKVPGHLSGHVGDVPLPS